MKRKDSMSLFMLEADVSKVGLASTTATVQDMYLLDSFISQSLCAGIMKLFD